MGTRADFYVEEDNELRWIGSVALDGYPSGFPELENFEDQDQFIEWFREHVQDREDYTAPSMGWPWPWEDSNTTDFAYRMQDGIGVSVSSFGGPWAPLEEYREMNGEEYEHYNGEEPDFPDMEEIQDVTFGERSGLLAINLSEEDE